MTSLRGQWIHQLSQLGEHEIQWRRFNEETGSSTVEILKYNVYKYEVQDNGMIIPVFVQYDWNIDSKLQVTDQFQYGLWSGKAFLVLHDKVHNQPPQQSFLCADVADLILPEDDSGGMGSGFGFGVGTFGFMDRLKDFDDDNS